MKRPQINIWNSNQQRTRWVDSIRSHSLFRNPQGMRLMREAYGIDDHASWLWRVKDEWTAESLRDEQATVSSQCALQSGVAHAQQRRLSQVVEHYLVALEWDEEQRRSDGGAGRSQGEDE